MEIDFLFEEQTNNGIKYFVIFGNYSRYIQISGITKDHLPIVKKGTQPLTLSTQLRTKMIGKKPVEEYRFIGPVYFAKVFLT